MTQKNILQKYILCHSSQVIDYIWHRRGSSHDDPPVCQKCHSPYPSKEALKLHNCESIIATMAPDGEVRDSRVRGSGRQSLAESPGPSLHSSPIASPMIKVQHIK